MSVPCTENTVADSQGSVVVKLQIRSSYSGKVFVIPSEQYWAGLPIVEFLHVLPITSGNSHRAACIVSFFLKTKLPIFLLNNLCITKRDYVGSIRQTKKCILLIFIENYIK